MSKIALCVNIDHIATVRQARGVGCPDVLEGARVCEESGAHGITVHLREDRRHIQDSDVFALKEVVKGKFNLEMALSDDIIAVARLVKPHQVTIVPEKREELTTEGGLDVRTHFERIKHVASLFHDLGVTVSLFIEPDIDTVRLSKEAGADYIEIHTGSYCTAFDDQLAEGLAHPQVHEELSKIISSAEFGRSIGIGINAGHGLNYDNLPPVLGAPGLEELNIGFSIIARSIFSGLQSAVKEMLAVISAATK